MVAAHRRRACRPGPGAGGGAARGFAHIGVIQVLEETASARPGRRHLGGQPGGGALRPGAPRPNWAAGADGRRRHHRLGLPAARADPRRRRWRATCASRPGASIEQMKPAAGHRGHRPGQRAPILFRSGDTGVAVRASSAVPAVPAGEDRRQREYVDGGLSRRCRCASRARWAPSWWWRWTSRRAGRQRHRRPRRCCCRPSRSWAAASPRSCATPTWSCGRAGRVSGADFTARKRAIAVRPGAAALAALPALLPAHRRTHALNGAASPSQKTARCRHRAEGTKNADRGYRGDKLRGDAAERPGHHSDRAASRKFSPLGSRRAWPWWRSARP